VTLAGVFPAARQLSAAEKLKLIRILAEDLDMAEDIAPLEPFKTYDLPTPYDNFGAGAVLMEALSQSTGGRPSDFSEDSTCDKTTGMIRLLLVDDQNIVRKGLKVLLEAQSEFEVVGEASNGREAIAYWNIRCDLLGRFCPWHRN
jgi:hypothetical protein